MFCTGYMQRTHPSLRAHVRRISPLFPSIMLLSHSPWSHFSRSPGVCEGQSGLSSHKPRLHTPLPAKVCVRTKCNTARRNGNVEMEGAQMILLQRSAGPLHTACGSSCLTLLGSTVHHCIEIRIGCCLLKRHIITRQISRLRALRLHDPKYNKGVCWG